MRAIFYVILFTVLSAAGLRAQEVSISEFLAVNSGSQSDEDGDSSDWIELYNGGSESVSLTGWYLTDDSEDRFKWPLPSVDLGAGSYLVVFASGKDRRAVGAELHTNFSLEGESRFKRKW